MTKQKSEPIVSIIRAKQPNYKVVADIIVEKSLSINIEKYKVKKKI
ncbi:hypothetical protein ACIQXG_10065 [Lysinibacillus sphaericus]